MDKNPRALLYELLRGGLGIGLIAWYGGWFEINHWVPMGSELIAGYLGLSLAMTALFVFTEVRQYSADRARQQELPLAS